jgi:CRISPR-associated protein Cas1
VDAHRDRIRKRILYTHKIYFELRLKIPNGAGRAVTEGRIRYHGDGALVRVQIDNALKEKARAAILRARELASRLERPPVAENENLCKRCSLAPICLPEENRVISERGYQPVRLFPERRERTTLHIFGVRTTVGKSGETLVVRKVDEDDVESVEKLPIHEIDSINLHGNCQISSQLLRFLAYHEIPVHWFTGGGEYVGGIGSAAANVQRRIRQYRALCEDALRLDLARRLVVAKCESQVRYLLRATRGRAELRKSTEAALAQMRASIRKAAAAESADELLGFEGSVARRYFEILPALLSDEIDPALKPDGRSRRPPLDRFNAALSFMYSLLYKSVRQAIIAVGLEPAFGFYHSPRSAAEPLALDVMELFRLTLCDVPLIGSMNRRAWDADEDFTVSRAKVWLSESGRRKAVTLYESRLDDLWRHPVTGYSLSYYRMIELEVRLLEKEWGDQSGLFARARLR